MAATELPIDINMEEVLRKFDELGKRVDAIGEKGKKSGQELGDRLGSAFTEAVEKSRNFDRQMNILENNLGKIANQAGLAGSKFAGFAESIIKGFGQGGFAGAALGLVTQLTLEINQGLEEQEKQWQRVRAAAAAAADKEVAALALVATETKRLAVESRTLELIRTKGMTDGQARAQAELESISGDRAAGQAKLANIREEIVERQKAQDALGEYIRTMNTAQATPEGRANVRALPGLQRDMADGQSQIARLRDQQEILAASMVGSAQTVANKVRAAELVAEREKIARAEKHGADLLKIRSGTGDQMVSLFRVEQERLKAVEEEFDLDMEAEADRGFRERAERDQDQFDRRDQYRRAADRDAALLAGEAADAEVAIAKVKADALIAEDKRRTEAEKTQSDERKAIVDAAKSAGQAGVRDIATQVAEYAFFEEEKTKKQRKEEAERAGVKALVAAAEAAYLFATSQIPQAVSATISAAAFAAIAGLNAAAVSGAPSQSKSEVEAERAKAERAKASKSAGFGSRGSGGRDSGGFTVVLPSGGVLLTKADVARAVGEAQREWERRR